MNTKILIVDDEIDLQRLIQKRFKQRIMNKDYELIFANNGEEALKILQGDPNIGVILTDINMPIMDGLTLLGKISALGRVYKAVVVSAYEDMKNIRIAMNRGASDFVTKPVDFSDLEQTIDKMLTEYTHQYNFHAIQMELDIAKSIQEDMLPKNYHPFTDSLVEISGKMVPAKEVGGDFYDFFPLGDDKMTLFISDVSGKSIPACLYMTVTKVLYRMLANKNMESGQIMTQLNGLLTAYIPYMFVTAFTGIIDFKTGIFTYSNAGHCLPYILHANGNVEQLVCESGIPLGIVELGSEHSDFQQYQITLEEGDCLFFYTDGVTEAMNVNQQMFGEARLMETLKKCSLLSPQEILDAVFNDIRSFANNENQHDDITMLSVRFHKPK